MQQALLILCVLVMATLAGCTQATDAGPDGASPTVITDPLDYSYVANQTDGSGWHVHDYWRGQDRLTLLDDQVRYGSFVTYNSPNGAPVHTFRLPAGTTVPQGAAYVNVTVEWNFSNAEYGHVELWTRTADQRSLEPVGRIEHGVTHAIASTNDDNDPPHTQLSAWQFQIRLMPGSESSEVSYSNPEIRILVTADRGLAVPPWPPHPDFWNGQQELVLFSHEREVPYDAMVYVGGLGIGACSGCLGRHVPADGVLLPYDSQRVVVTLDLASGSPNNLRLGYRGADTWDMNDMDPDEASLDRLVFEIPTYPGMTDSPYAKHSLWEFVVLRDDLLMGSGAWSGAYTITVTAHKS